MLIFAHVFAGALLGLLFWHLTNDRRVVLVCVAGSILPDLIDKSLGLLFPSVIGGGRTVFHALVIIIIILCLLMCLPSTAWWQGGGLAGAVLLHQIMDEMWTQPEDWFWPLLGPFTGQMIPDYIGFYFWHEISSPSEWIFFTGSLLILAKTYYYSK